MADTVIGASLTLDTAPASANVKSFKAELRAANEELLQTAKNFGPTSDAALAAAQKVGQLKNEIEDAQKLANNFNTDGSAGVKAFGSAVQGLSGGFAALQGVMGLLGSQSEDVQKALLKVQAALAISQGVESINDAIKGFGNLQAVIKSTTAFKVIDNAVTKAAAVIMKLFSGSVDTTSASFRVLKGAIAVTGIGLLVVAIGTLVQAFQNWTTAAEDAAAATKEANETAVKYANIGLKSELDFIKRQTDLNVAKAELAGKSEAEIQKIKENSLKQQASSYGRYYAQVKDADIEAGQDAINQTKNLQSNLTLSQIQFQLTQKQRNEQEAQRNQQAAKQATQQAKQLAEQKLQEQEKEDADLLASRQKIFDAQLEFNKGLKKIADQERKDQQERDEADQKDLEDKYAAQQDAEQAAFDKMISAKNAAALAQIAIDKSVYDARRQFVSDTANLLGVVSDLIGKQTAAGKALGIAQATINTWVGATEVLRAKSVLPEPLATISKIINVAAIIATGLNAVKNIVKTQVPGGGGSSAPSIGSGASAPLTPQIQQTSTTLDQGQVNQLGNATVRAFVTESDVSNSQERITRLNRSARLGG